MEDNNFVEVSVSTTSGFFPEEGTNRVPVKQKVRVELEKAAKALKLTSTEGWVATVANPPREINVDQSYEDNGLAVKVEISWGPRQGGGGSCTN